MESWQIAMALGVGFVGSHHLMSHHPVRQRLIGALGLGPFLGVYSLVATAFYAPLAVLWWQGTRTTPVWWSLLGDPNARVLATTLSALGFALAIGAVVGGSRTSMLTQMSGSTTREIRGVNGFTRHPLFGGFVLYSLGHLLVDGGAVDVAFHGTNLAVAAIGGWHQDQRALQTDPTYAEWMARTRLFPLPWTVPGTVWPPRAVAGVAAGLIAATLARVFLHG